MMFLTKIGFLGLNSLLLIGLCACTEHEYAEPVIGNQELHQFLLDYRRHPEFSVDQIPENLRKKLISSSQYAPDIDPLWASFTGFLAQKLQNDLSRAHTIKIFQSLGGGCWSLGFDKTIDVCHVRLWDNMMLHPHGIAHAQERRILSGLYFRMNVVFKYNGTEQSSEITALTGMDELLSLYDDLSKNSPICTLQGTPVSNTGER